MKLFGLLEDYVQHGTLNVLLPDGTHRHFGSGSPEATIRIRDRDTLHHIVRNPGLEFGEWSRRFQVARPEVAERFDERFCRMWEFYLATCEASFRHWNQVVFQVQLAKAHGIVPTTRNYLYDARPQPQAAPASRSGP